MYHTGTELADGPRNLYHSFLAAAAPEVGKAGAVLVFNGMIHSARDVVKVSSTRTEGFASPRFGPLGAIEGRRVLVRRDHVREEHIATDNIEPNVGLIAASVGMDAGPVDAWIAGGARGLVVSAMGGGALPPAMGERLRELAAGGYPVVAASRCLEGSVHAQGRKNWAIILAGDLPAHKARIKLMLALAAVRDLSPEDGKRQLNKYFDTVS